MDFDDLLAANSRLADLDGGTRAPGRAARGIAVLCCMDPRLDPLGMLGLDVGEAAVLRTPGGRLTPSALTGLVVATHLLGVDRILVVAHTGCAMASGSDADVAEKVRRADGTDLSGMVLGSTSDQLAGLRHDVAMVRSHPHLDALVGGFLLDLPSGRLDHLV